MIEIHDISLSIAESLPTWPGDESVSIKQTSHLERGDIVTVSHLRMSVHTGTHIDAPAHFVLGGAGVEALDLSVLIGPVWVAETDANCITPAILDALNIPTDTKRVLFHTRNSALWAETTGFHKEFVAITEEGAQWLVKRGVRLVGIDYLSVAPFDAGVPTHRVLLEAGVIALEGLDLRGIRQGRYELICLPLKIAGGDGAPARAILIKKKEEKFNE